MSKELWMVCMDDPRWAASEIERLKKELAEIRPETGTTSAGVLMDRLSTTDPKEALRQMFAKADQLERELAEALRDRSFFQNLAKSNLLDAESAERQLAAVQSATGSNVTPHEWQRLVEVAREEGRIAGRNEALRERLDTLSTKPLSDERIAELAGIHARAYFDGLADDTLRGFIEDAIRQALDESAPVSATGTPRK